MFNIKMLTQKNTKLWLVSQHSLLESRRCFIVQCNHTTSSNSLVFVVFEPPPCHKAFTTHSFQCAGVFFMLSLHLKERTANQKMLNNRPFVEIFIHLSLRTSLFFNNPNNKQPFFKGLHGIPARSFQNLAQHQLMKKCQITTTQLL